MDHTAFRIARVSPYAEIFKISNVPHEPTSQHRIKDGNYESEVERMIQLWSSALLFTNGDQTVCSHPSALFRIQTDLTSEYIIIPVSHSELLYQINISLSCYSKCYNPVTDFCILYIPLLFSWAVNYGDIQWGWHDMFRDLLYQKFWFW